VSARIAVEASPDGFRVDHLQPLRLLEGTPNLLERHDLSQVEQYPLRGRDGNPAPKELVSWVKLPDAMEFDSRP